MSIIHRSSASGDASGVLTHEFARVWAGRRQSAARWGVAPRSWSAACGKAGGAREENRPPGWRGRRPYLSTIISVPPIATQKAVQTATTKSSVARGDQRSLL
jgi:hypothetical protein